jgi:deferrochelatase/peroxidase EfeB
MRNNDFNYGEQDPHGYACPFGSHARRLNPRDTAHNMNRRRTAFVIWINDRSFTELGNEHDPICGTQDGTLDFAVPKRPIRTVHKGLPAFTTLKGGAYFFLPGINALRYLPL